MLNDPTLLKRFWPKVNKTEGGCWEWTRCLSSAGYGKICVHGKSEYAHRVAWLHANGEIPDDLCVLHRCDNRRCVNPAHLFLGSKRDNTQDCIAKGRDNAHLLKRALTHCVRGHLLSGPNSYTNRHGKRVCRTCAREAVRARRA